MAAMREKAEEIKAYHLFYNAIIEKLPLQFSLSNLSEMTSPQYDELPHHQ